MLGEEKKARWTISTVGLMPLIIIGFCCIVLFCIVYGIPVLDCIVLYSITIKYNTNTNIIIVALTHQNFWAPVLYCIILYSFVLCFIVLYFIVLYFIVLYFIVLYFIVLYFIVLYFNLFYCIVFYCIVFYCIVFYCLVFINLI